MNYIVEYNMWTSTTTNDGIVGRNDDSIGGSDVHFSYKSKDKVYHGMQPVQVTNPINNKTLTIKAKFDTGAFSSSLDIRIAKLLGFRKELLDKCNKLKSIKIPKTTSIDDQKKLADKYEKELKKDFSEISKVKVIRSSSGFSIRIFVDLILDFDGRSLLTTVNIRDRHGLQSDMLIGLSDIL